MKYPENTIHEGTDEPDPGLDKHIDQLLIGLLKKRRTLLLFV
jgi:hypothetical protein